MFDAQDYQLLDFGDGRRLERFGPVVLDRPCPAAEAIAKAAPALWSKADACFQRDPSENGQPERGRWVLRGELPEGWTIHHGALVFELKRTDFGHVGIFPEQHANWDWIQQQAASCSSAKFEPLKILNLFAYTGGSTLAAAAAGADVTHVDAAKNIVVWARRNAELSRLAAAPIRWIAEDAMKYAQRELRRGRRYDAVILDPPSYGHGPEGEPLATRTASAGTSIDLSRTDRPAAAIVLLTCHTPGCTPERLGEMLAAHFGSSPAFEITAAALVLHDAIGRTLPSGAVARCVVTQTG